MDKYPEQEPKATDSVGIPKLIDGIRMEDEVSVTLPAWVWAVLSVVLVNIEEAEQSSYVQALLVRVQEAIMHPGYLVARQIRHESEMLEQQRIQEAIKRQVFPYPFGSGEDA